MEFTTHSWDKTDSGYDHHAVIYNGKDAKVYINGKLITKPTMFDNIKAWIKSIMRKAKNVTVFDEHDISESEQWFIAKQNDAEKKAFNKFMTKQQKKPRARYLKQLRYGA